ncbi:hypothetical protein [Cellvibrio sp. UBA7671]|uniref:hypothetical protein n=1 Tax=Cellvibrio sp. UBA7671 TaxID=1946312 RepID=UPI002F353B2F
MRIFKFLFIIFAFFLAYVFSDNVKGYFKFKEYCKKEAGFHFYKPIVKKSAWFVPSRADAMEISALKDVSFARYKDGDEYFDVKYNSGKPYELTSFEVSPSDMSMKTAYKLVNISKAIHGEQRLSVSGREVVDESGGKVLSFYMFSYANFDRDYTPLDMNPYLLCDSPVVSDRLTYDDYWAAFNSAFIQQED